MGIDLTEYAEAINNALSEGATCVLATCGEETPDIGFKGSMIVFDQDHLAYWERTRGGHLANLQHNPGAAVLYFSPQRGLYLRMYGQAKIFEDGPARDLIMSQVPEPELEKDPERKGIAVQIRVDRLVEAFNKMEQRREGVAAR